MSSRTFSCLFASSLAFSSSSAATARVASASWSSFLVSTSLASASSTCFSAFAMISLWMSSSLIAETAAASVSLFWTTDFLKMEVRLFFKLSFLLLQSFLNSSSVSWPSSLRSYLDMTWAISSSPTILSFTAAMAFLSSFLSIPPLSSASKTAKARSGVNSSASSSILISISSSSDFILRRISDASKSLASNPSTLLLRILTLSSHMKKYDAAEIASSFFSSRSS
mmetsp:Transcript_1632/g.2981  ORF Transcript_1632/g.2981 Transcript_1632/m.2981 type:complete len:225 (-) Transcript_1632:140-814(-)